MSGHGMFGMSLIYSSSGPAAPAGSAAGVQPSGSSESTELSPSLSIKSSQISSWALEAA
jgi:hypothetical protein